MRMVYGILHRLPRHDWQTPRNNLPENGIYAFFERGEAVEVGGWDRVVYVGAHTGDGNLRARIREHYGPLYSFVQMKLGSGSASP